MSSLLDSSLPRLASIKSKYSQTSTGTEAPSWLMADPVAARLLAAGRGLDEVYAVVERLAIVADGGGQ